jgi:hypothetical protein
MKKFKNLKTYEMFVTPEGEIIPDEGEKAIPMEFAPEDQDEHDAYSKTDQPAAGYIEGHTVVRDFNNPEIAKLTRRYYGSTLEQILDNIQEYEKGLPEGEWLVVDFEFEGVPYHYEYGELDDPGVA